MTFDFSTLADDIASTSENANVAKTGGAGYVPPAEGVAKLRLVGYIETGKHFKAGNPAKRIPDKDTDNVVLIFELSGSKWEPKVLEDGTKIPQRISVKLAKSLNEKATYFKLFKRMNYEGKATHFAQLIGQPFLGTVSHFKPAVKEGDEQIIIAGFRDSDGNLTIRPPRIDVMDEESGEVTTKTVMVPPAISEHRLFVWNYKHEGMAQMWESIFIPQGDSTPEDGKEVRSRNVYQDAIKAAVNFEGSPVQQFLLSAGIDMGIPAATKTPPPPAKEAADAAALDEMGL